MAAAKRKPVQFVVAIDFGTAYSGYAYSSVEQYKKDKLDICANQAWNSGVAQLISYKTPTCLLLTKNGEFVSYGYEAESAYANILLDKKDSGYLYFRKFKMELYNRKPSLQMTIKDIRGFEHSALDVFSLSVNALRDKCLDYLKDKGYSLHEDETKWSVTVPAIWTDEAKMFMRKACEEAGIPKHRLIIALEPEVASLYCQVWNNKQMTRNIFRPGVKCLVVDLGGGTVDITGHEILKKGLFKEICSCSGSDCGGTSVDEEFFSVLQNILGKENMDKFRTEHTMGYLELFSSFESVKRNITREQRDKVTVGIPIGSLNSLNPEKNLETMLKNSEYCDKITLLERHSKIQMEIDFVKSLFLKTIDRIISKIQEVFLRETTHIISVILLVGGLSESKIVQQEIKAAFNNKTVVLPHDPTLAVLKGAVLFGHRPDVVTTRIAQFSYGRKIRPIFNPKVHDESRRVSINGQDRCNGVFELLVKSGTSIPIGKKITKVYHTVSKEQEYIRVALYKSPYNTTKYVDDSGCSLVGACLVPVQVPLDHRREVTVDFEFGDTEIFVRATDNSTRNVLRETFRLE